MKYHCFLVRDILWTGKASGRQFDVDVSLVREVFLNFVPRVGLELWFPWCEVDEWNEDTRDCFVVSRIGYDVLPGRFVLVEKRPHDVASESEVENAKRWRDWLIRNGWIISEEYGIGDKPWICK